MTILRRQLLRAVRNLPCLRGPALALSLATAASLGSGTAAAAVTHTHAHHPGISPLPAASYTETSSSRTPKKRKGSSSRGNAAVATHTSGASRDRTGTVRQGKSPKGRHGRPAPADDAVPMLRTGHGRGHSNAYDRHAVAETLIPSTRHGGYSPILVDSHGRPISRARFAAMRAAAPAVHWTATPSSRALAHTASAIAASTAASRPSPTSTQELVAAARRSSANPASFADAHAGAFTEGISRPDDDERLPRSETASADIGTAVVMTPNTARPQPSAPAGASPVVQGFGPEMALAPGNSNVNRPGITRRRDHPVSASALPGFAPLPLAERDAITEAAVSPAVLPEIYDHDGRLMMPAPLKGSREVLIHQNTMADSDGLERIRDDGELDQLRAEHALVTFPSSGSLQINGDLPYNRRCARPWTVQFATDISHDFSERFHQPITVTSAVRTVSYQLRLQRVNGNAAATEGDAASPHLTGQAIDLGKRGMSASELAWMRAYLMPLMSAGKIDVEEEFHQACFHISVYRRYAADRTPVHQVAQVHPAPVPDSQDTP